MLDMWLMDSFETVSLYQFDDPAEARLHVVRQTFEFFSNAVVEQLYDPRHLFTLLHFCNIRKAFVRSASSKDKGDRFEF